MLSWIPQVQQMIKKVNRALYGLKVIRPCTSLSLRKRLIESSVVLHFDYCCLVYSDATKKLSGQLQRLSNSCIRYIYGIRRDEHITSYRRRLKWMRIETRKDYFASLIMYKLIRMKDPPFLLPLFKQHKLDKPSLCPRKFVIYLLPRMIGVFILFRWSILIFGTLYHHVFVTFILMQDTKRVLESTCIEKIFKLTWYN